MKQPIKYFTVLCFCDTMYLLSKSVCLFHFRDFVHMWICQSPCYSSLQSYAVFETSNLGLNNIYSRKSLYRKGNNALIFSILFPWNINTAPYCNICFYHLAQFINWNWCCNITLENNILFIRKLLGNTTVPERKSHLENELDKLLKMWDSVGVKRTMSHKIHSNSIKSGRVPAVKSAYSSIDFQELSE